MFESANFTLILAGAISSMIGYIFGYFACRREYSGRSSREKTTESNQKESDSQ